MAKTERARRPESCRASLTGVDWICKGFDIWRRQVPEWYLCNDFWLFETTRYFSDFSKPLSYSSFVRNMHHLLEHAVRKKHDAADEHPQLVDTTGLSLHSFRRKPDQVTRPMEKHADGVQVLTKQRRVVGQEPCSGEVKMQN